MTLPPLEPFDPAALIRRVKRRRPIRGVAELFGMRPGHLSVCIAQLRKDDPNFPVRRRKLRGVIYVEPSAVQSPNG
jgi:hypothetical protein